ncbi:MAG: hypothetical protein HY238_19215 [Acidobacteria bacterium]|nr:hypothetical protein [Acidobacteriota bacterium]
MLGDLYLSLATQIDLLIGDNKWLEIRPQNPAEVAAQASRELEQLQRRLQSDFDRTQEWVRNPSAARDELEAFRSYLEDPGFRDGRSGQ